VIPYEELARLGRLRRLRKLAQAALDAYGLAGARLTFIRYSGNGVYRVDDPKPASSKGRTSPYVENRYALRLHQPDYQVDQAIRSELEWLAALSRDTALAIPEPVRTLAGDLSVEVQIPGVPRRRCSLLRWMKGRMLSQSVRARHFKAVGRLMAGLHQHAARWQPSAGFTRPRYDWEGLFGDNDFVKAPAAEIRSQLPKPYYEPFMTVTNQVRQVMDELGQEEDAFGLIHADLSVGYNLLFSGGEASAIDFDDCAFGYWMFDLGVALSDWRQSESFPRYRDALLDGYAEISTLPEEQLAHLDLFIATWHAFEMAWAMAGVIRFPSHRQGYDRWVERAAKDLIRCLAYC
jgi:Ser/Thr protein kinase RdoA (MazF antagonist)